MTILKLQCIALYTLIRRELIRMFRIPTQTFLPSIITTTLYFLIFGSIIGPRVGNLDGLPYHYFIAPGLIMLAVITNAYGNVASSLYIVRFQKSIEEMLVSPMHPAILFAGYVSGGILRGLFIGFFLLIVSSFFISIPLNHLFSIFGVIFLVAMLFAMAGFLNGMLARTFEDISFVPTFILSPLVYLGGVFYSPSMLPLPWQKFLIFNPIYHMVSLLRYVMGGHESINIPLSITIILCSILILLGMNAYCIRKGMGFKE